MMKRHDLSERITSPETSVPRSTRISFHDTLPRSSREPHCQMR